MNAKIENQIIEAANCVQVLVNAEFAKRCGQPEAGSSLDQCGLRDGREIIMDLVRHGEAGAALEHLVYMVRETGIKISEDTRSKIGIAAAAMNEDVDI